MTPKVKKILTRESFIFAVLFALLWAFYKGYVPFINVIVLKYKFENTPFGFIRFYIFIRVILWVVQELIFRIRMKFGLFSKKEKDLMKEEIKREKQEFNWVPYVLLFCFSLFAALAIMYFYAYFITGSFKAAFKVSEGLINSNHPLFINSIWVIFLTFLAGSFAVKKYLATSLKCSLCGNPGKDFLKTGDKTIERLCRNHLLEQFRQKFLYVGYKMVVVYPGLEGRKQSYYYTYGYFTKSDLKKYGFLDIAGSLLERGLRSISGKCNKCAGEGNIAFFGKGSFFWENDYPVIDKITQGPEIICNKCAADLIIPSLRDFEGYFANPVEVPGKEEGILFPWTQ